MPILLESEGPVLQIEFVAEAEVFGQLRERKLDVELNLRNSRASLIQSRISGLSQKLSLQAAHIK